MVKIQIGIKMVERNKLLLINKTMYCCLISPSSIDKNAKIVRSDVMIRVRTPILPLILLLLFFALDFCGYPTTLCN